MTVPTNEKGHPGGYAVELEPRTGRKRYAATSPNDLARELHFPDSLVIYDAMRTETQLSGVLEAIAQPILSADWHLTSEGVPDNVTDFVATELGLRTSDKPLSRIHHRGIDLREHIAETVDTMLWAGFAVAEQVYDVGPPTPAQEGLGAGVDGMVRHLRKLAPRPPRTITKIEVERDGGLAGIRQTPLDYEGANIDDTFITVDALVFYSHKRRGAAWQGESVLRPAYRPWALKDIYLRLDAQAVDKHSSGFWRGTSTDPARADRLFDELTEMASGDRAAVVHDQNDTVELLGLKGSLVDITPRLNYLDQQMSRAALAMFLDLGHDNGARSLGETHLRVFYTKVRGMADLIARTITDHVIRDLVRHNYPDGTPYPELSPGDLVAQQGTSPEAIRDLMASGALTYDRGMEDHFRSRYGIPALPEPETTNDDDGGLERERAEADILKTRTDAAGTAFRIGYEPEQLRDAYKLPPGLEHPGWLPTTIKTQDKLDVEDDAAVAEAVANIAKAQDQETVAASQQTAVRHATNAYQALMDRVNKARG